MRDPAPVRRIVGGGYLVCAGINLGLVLADSTVYRHFADASYLSFVRSGWTTIVMAHPLVWIVLLAAGELTIGTLLLSGSRPAIRVGWWSVVAFHLLLMLFGFGMWLWSLPVLVAAIPLALRDGRRS